MKKKAKEQAKDCGPESTLAPSAGVSSSFQKVINDTMVDALVVIDKSGTVLSANKACRETFGFSEKQLVGKNVNILMGGKDHKNHDHYIDKYIKTGQGKIIGRGPREVTGRHRDGHALDLELAVNPIEIGGEKFFVGSLRDVSLRKQAEAKVDEIQRHYKLLAENTTDIVFLEDRNSKIIFISPALTLQLGVKPEDVVGKNSWDLVNPEDREKVHPVWEKCVLGDKKPCKSEFRMQHRDGHFLWFEAVCAPILDDEGKLTDVISVCRNISDRKEIESRLQMLADNASDIITLRDGDGKVLYITPSFEKHLGHSYKAEIGRGPWYRLVHPDDQEKGKDWHKTVFGKGKPYGGDFRLRDAKGNYQWFESLTEPIKDEKGKVIASVTSSRNITEYKQAESESLRLGRIVEESLNEIYVFDATTLKFISVNRGARENLGYSTKELQKLTPVSIKPKFSKGHFLDLVSPLLNGEREQIYFETVHRRKDGTDYDVEVYLQLSQTGADPVFVAIIEDITEKMVDQAKLQQAHKMEAVGNLSGGIAHDFNNLLTAILGSLQLIEMLEKNLGEETKECLKIALNSTRRGAELTSKLLAFSRKQTLKPVVVDIKTMVRDLMPLLKRTIDESIAIESHFPKEKALVKLDAGLLESALLNLAVNARDAMPDGGQLVFEVNREVLTKPTALARDLEVGDYIVISISDTGGGMAEDVRNHIFEPFFSTKGLEKGTGLGLSMVYGFVKQSGGYINVYSEEGVGTTFKLYFREAGGGETLAKPKPVIKTQSQKATGTILLVEDDEGVRNFIAQALKTRGYTVLEAEDGPEAREIMDKAKTIDLLLTDVVLPKGMSGVDVGKVFGEKFPGKPVIYSSGYTEKAGAKRNLLPKGEQLLSKPYDLEVLFDWVLEKLNKG